MKNNKHPKIQALRLKAQPINSLSGSYVDAEGNLQLIDLRLKVVDEGERILEGYLAVFGVKDMSGETCVKGCFAKSINERGPGSKSKYKVVMLWQHIMSEPIGQFLELKEDDYGLYFKAKLDPIPTADRCLIQVKSGTINQFSFGYDYVWDKVRYDEATDSIMLLEVELYEGSAVTIGCNMETYAIKSAEDIISAKEELDYETEDFIKALPRSKQLELRQLITKHISLAKIKPTKEKLKSLKKKQADEGIVNIGGYKLNLNEFKQ